jgi:hypothetical protein
MRPKVALHNFLTSAVLGAVTWLLAPFCGPAVALVVIAKPLFINVDESIVWQTPSPFQGATLTASSLFQNGGITNGAFEPTGSFGAQDYDIHFPNNPLVPPGPTTVFLPAVQINWGDSIAWKFNGSIAAAVASFPVTACASSVLHPPNPCVPVPIGTDLVGGFAPIDLSGGVFAFDSAVQIGTWSIRVTEAPEPSSLMLLGIGFASLPIFRRWRPREFGARQIAG